MNNEIDTSKNEYILKIYARNDYYNIFPEVNIKLDSYDELLFANWICTTSDPFTCSIGVPIPKDRILREDIINWDRFRDDIYIKIFYKSKAIAEFGSICKELSRKIEESVSNIPDLSIVPF